MKTQLPVILVFLFVPSLWRTLLVSAPLCLQTQKLLLRLQKNQPALAGSPLPPPHHLLPYRSAPSPSLLLPTRTLPNLFIQSPNNL